MATRFFRSLSILTDYTQAEEDAFASTLLSEGASAGVLIYNTTEQNARTWNGAIFESYPLIPSSNIPLATTVSSGTIPATGAPSGKFLKDDLTWVSIQGGGDMLKSENLSGLTNYVVARTNLGLSNVDNTSDANKPVSVSQQTALDLKANLLSPTLVTPNIGVATATSLSTTGAITSSGAGIGYTTGAGGTVTQITSRTTSVTLNKLCGNITMFSAAQAANALVTFTLTNSFITAGDFVLVRHISATNGGAWVFSVVAGSGSCTISIRNQTTGSITEATPLRFVIIKSVVS